GEVSQVSRQVPLETHIYRLCLSRRRLPAGHPECGLLLASLRASHRFLPRLVGSLTRCSKQRAIWRIARSLRERRALNHSRFASLSGSRTEISHLCPCG